MLGPRIAALRRNAGWSQAELAAKLGVSPSAIGMYEQGRREPAVDTLVALAALFGVSTDYLLTGKTQSAPEAALVGQALQRALTEADQLLSGRKNAPFTRQELAILFAALLSEHE